MKTTDIKYVEWNNTDIEKIKKAERRKAMLENKGYNLKSTMTNAITGYCKLTYEKVN